MLIKVLHETGLQEDLCGHEMLCIIKRRNWICCLPGFMLDCFTGGTHTYMLGVNAINCNAIQWMSVVVLARQAPL